METKYRAFVKSIGRMVQVDTIDFRSGTITYSYPPGVNVPVLRGDYELMMLVESFDDDSELYEGDIVKNKYGNIAVVERWDMDYAGIPQFGLHIIYKADPMLELEEHKEWRELELIGNKFENPELVATFKE